MSRAPDYLIECMFLGVRCDKGVNPIVAERLSQTEHAIRAAYDSLPPDQRIDLETGETGVTFERWCAIREQHHSWRPGGSHHSAGAAVDINYTSNPYIATRTGTVFGGEAGGGFAGVREAAVAVYDRSSEFIFGEGQVADVAARRQSESTQEVWDRFAATSAALSAYLTLAFRADLRRIDRRPVPEAEYADVALLDQIPQSELRDPAEAFEAIASLTSDEYFLKTHPGKAVDPVELYYRILRDYELVRIPMVFGTPSVSPAATRNPARGFLTLRSEIVVALCDAGMRWGASDFGRESGDMQHFDLADNGGYPVSG